MAKLLLTTALAALLIMLILPGNGAAEEASVVTLEQLYADFLAYNDKYDQTPFEVRQHMLIFDVPSYRGKRLKITAQPWKISRNQKGLPEVMVKLSLGQGSGMNFYFSFDTSEMASLTKAMQAVIERRPVTIIGTLGSLNNNGDLLFKDCVAEGPDPK